MAPTTPVRQNAVNDDLVPSPGDIVDFLKYAESRGVRNALRFCDVLERENCGPDVLAEVDGSILHGSPFKIPFGDAQRLKKRAIEWWNAPDGKRVRYRNSDSDWGHSSIGNNASSTSKTVAYETLFPDNTGRMRWYGGPPKPQDIADFGALPRDENTYIYRTDDDEWKPVPVGFVPGSPEE